MLNTSLEKPWKLFDISRAPQQCHKAASRFQALHNCLLSLSSLPLKSSQHRYGMSHCLCFTDEKQVNLCKVTLLVSCSTNFPNQVFRKQFPKCHCSNHSNNETCKMGGQACSSESQAQEAVLPGCRGLVIWSGIRLAREISQSAARALLCFRRGWLCWNCPWCWYNFLLPVLKTHVHPTATG